MSRNARLGLWLAFVGALIALAYDARAAAGKPSSDILYHYSTAAAAAVQYAVMLGIVVGIAGGSRRLLALRPPASWGRALGLGLAVFVGIYAVERVVDPFLHPGREQGLTPHGWQPAHAGAYAANFVVVAIVGPIVEEITYRGLGATLLARFGAVFSILGTGVLFGLSHGLVDALPVLAAFGWGLAWLRFRTGSAYPGMVVHGCFNALALIAAVTIGG